MSLLQIGIRHQTIPIIQGGMGVGVSLEQLAGSVAACGGLGTISTADCGYRESDFHQHPEKANLRALRREIATAKRISRGNGLIAINAMVATQQYEDAVRTAVQAGVDAVISGAGLPLQLPELVEEGRALIAPIVSSGRAARLILNRWKKKYQRYPDFLVIEGPKAGGHLGFKEEELLERKCKNIYDLLREVTEEVQPFIQAKGKDIPLFIAGGIRSKEEIYHALQLGASGVQIGTPFIATEECDASQAYKDILIQASSKDAEIIHSPVGMPGRAIHSPLIHRLAREGRIPPRHCSHCIKGCNPGQVPYCITQALIEAVKGNWEEGLFFCGSELDQINEMTTVSKLLSKLLPDYFSSKDPCTSLGA